MKHISKYIKSICHQLVCCERLGRSPLHFLLIHACVHTRTLEVIGTQCAQLFYLLIIEILTFQARPISGAV